MTAELFLLGIAFPDATELTGDVLLFMLLAPLQFFNRYVGLKLSGERPRLIALYRHIFTIILLLWLLLQLAPIGIGGNPGHPCAGVWRAYGLSQHWCSSASSTGSGGLKRSTPMCSSASSSATPR